MKFVHSVIETEHGPVEYTSIGKGIPILFVHGGHSNCMEQLSHKGFDKNRFQLITPSRPGYAGTPLVNHENPEQVAELLKGLLDYLRLEKVIVYGISAGGPTAIAFAANFPQNVNKLVLASAVSKKWMSKDDSIYRTAKVIFHRRIEGFTWLMVRFFGRLFPSLIAKNFHSQFSKKRIEGSIGKKDRNELIEMLGGLRSGSGFLNDLDHTVDDVWLKKIECPTLIIHSINDNSISLDHPHHAEKMIKNATLVTIDNLWGHLIWLGEDSHAPINKATGFVL